MPLIVHLHQVRRIGRCDGSAIGQSCEPVQDRLCATPLVGWRLGALGEDPVAARRGADAGDMEGAIDGDIADVWQAGQTRSASQEEVSQAMVERLDEILHRAGRLFHEGDGNCLRPCLYLDGRRAQIVVHLHHGIDIEEADSLPVDGHLQLFALLVHPEEEGVGGEVEGALEDVFTICREVVPNDDSAPCAEGSSFDVAGLRKGRRQMVYLFRGRRFPLADGDTADLACCTDVSGQEGGGYFEHLCHVVEAVAHVIGR